MAEGSAAVALLFEMALREGRRATFRSPEELWPVWAGGASPTGPLEGLLPIEGGVASGRVEGGRGRALEKGESAEEGIGVVMNQADFIQLS